MDTHLNNMKEALQELKSEAEYIERFKALSRIEIASMVGILNSACLPGHRLKEWLHLLPSVASNAYMNINLSRTVEVSLYSRTEAIDICVEEGSSSSSMEKEWRYLPLGVEKETGRQIAIKVNCKQFTSDHLDKLVFHAIDEDDDDVGAVYLTPTLTVDPVVSMEKMVGSENENTIRGVLNRHTAKCKFDKQWLRSVMQFIISYRMRSEEHIAFLGGYSIGTHKLLWTSMDEARWWDLLEVSNSKDVAKDFLALPTTNKEFKVAGNVTNMSFPYVCHRVINGEFSDAEKEKAVMAIMSLMHYQFLSSLFRSPRFKYGASEEISNAAYDALNRKSLLKQHGSWEALIQARCYQILNSDSKHAATFKTFTDDSRVIYIVIDTQNSIRKVVNRLTTSYYNAKDRDDRIAISASTFTGEEGEAVIKDIISRTNVIINQGLAFSLDRHDLIHNETIEVTLRLVPSADVRYLKEVLVELVRQRNRKIPAAEELIRELVMYMEEFLRAAPPEEKKFVFAVQKVVNMMRSSQATDEKALTIKESTMDIVTTALSKRPTAVQASARIALVTYLAVRLMTYQR